jgi:transposase
MFAALGSGDVIDQTVCQDTSQRQGSVGQAAQAMILNGRGFVHQRLSLVPYFFANKPLERLIGAEIEAPHLHDDVLGRALDALYDVGVTPLYTLMATEAWARRGLATSSGHLDTTSFHVDGRYNRTGIPEETVMHIPQGSSRDHRPDVNQVMLARMVEHPAGIPLWMKPRSGNSRDPVEVGRVVDEHLEQWRSAARPRSVVADSALYSAAHRGTLATRAVTWLTRVPAPLTEVPVPLAHVAMTTMAPRTDG